MIALAGCGSDPEPITQLVLVADSDLALDSVSFEVREAGGLTRSASRSGSGPSFVSLVQETGPLTNLTVTATGRQGDKAVLTRTHVLSFVVDETRVVPLDLYASCVGVKCSAGQTCAERGCRPEQLAAAELSEWRGQPVSPFPAKDAGLALDAGWLRPCGGPMPIDTSKDPMNCGACGLKCGGKEHCELGRCQKK
ncbi:MAG TPA: hypothetical protein VFX59_19285 [Polyangiales bacterium]|nr:hypothetical protein [Polyangiales bacterium]